jgi:hypothetical protein
MRLSELKPTFLKIEPASAAVTYRMTDKIEEADGVQFLCPKCFAKNNGPVGTHSVLCWAPHVPQTINPTPGRWKLEGTSYEDLSLVAGSSSVALLGGCAWHGYITKGEAITI